MKRIEICKQSTAMTATPNQQPSVFAYCFSWHDKNWQILEIPWPLDYNVEWTASLQCVPWSEYRSCLTPSILRFFGGKSWDNFTGQMTQWTATVLLHWRMMAHQPGQGLIPPAPSSLTGKVKNVTKNFNTYTTVNTEDTEALRRQS